VTSAAVRPDAPVALVTGASGGIGEALARLFARDGHRLLLAARSVERLGRVAETCRTLGAPAVAVIPVDLARPEGAAQLLEAVRAARTRVDVLVNNAGYGLAGRFADTALATELEMIQLNVTTLTQLTKALLPDLLAAAAAGRRGGVLNVASTASFQPGPYMAVYYATKAYVLSFSEALAEELAGAGLHVTALCPGPTATGFAARADMTQSRLFRLGLVADVDDVAQAGYDGFRRGRRIVVPGLVNTLLVQANRFAPRRLSTRIVALLNAGRAVPSPTPRS
jgi:uncharacterized protein